MFLNAAYITLVICLDARGTRGTRGTAYLGIRGVCRGDAEVKAHDLPRSTFVKDDVLCTQVAMDHFYPTVEKR